MIEKLKSKTILDVLTEEGVKIYENLNGLELLQEDEDGTEIKRINKEFLLIDNSLDGLKNLKVENNQIILDDISYDYSEPTQMFIDSNNGPDTLYIRLVNEFLENNKIEKVIFLVYDNIIEDFGLCVSDQPTFNKVINVIRELEILEDKNPKEANLYIYKGSPRVIELLTADRENRFFKSVVIHRS